MPGTTPTPATTNRVRARAPRAGRSRAAVSIVALLALGLLAACVAPPELPGDTTTTTTTTTTTQPEPTTTALCRVWEQRNRKGPDGPLPPERPFAYLLDDDTVVRAFEVVQVGEDCQQAGARLTFFNGELIGRDLYLPADNSLDGPPRQASPYPQTLAEGQPQAPAIEIATFNVELTAAGIRIWGTLRVTAEGQVSIVSFDGTLRDLQNFVVQLDAPALVLPGLTGGPIAARGRFERSGGANRIDLRASAPSIQVDDLQLKGVELALSATTTTGMEVSVRGSMSSAGQQVQVDLAARFDALGRLVDLDGTIDASLRGAGPGGWWELDGTVNLRGDAAGIDATFRGRGRFGGDSVARAAGELTWASNGDAILTGVFEVDAGGSRLRLEGSVTFTGSSASPSLAAVAAGAFVGTTDQGEVVEVRGTVRVVTVGGVTTTTVTGDLRVGNLRGTGSAVVESNGSRTRLRFSGRVAAGPLLADVDGDLVFDDGVVDSVELTGQLKAPLVSGGVSADGSVRIGGDRRGLSVEITGRIQSVADKSLDVAGTVVAWFEPSGALRGLRGMLGGTVSDGDWTIASFLGSFASDGTTTVLNGSGLALGPNVSYGQLSASLIVQPGSSRLNAAGQVAMATGSKRVFGDVLIVDNELVMLRAALVFPPMFIEPERIWARVVYDKGGCARSSVIEHTFLIGLFGAADAVRTSLGCRS